MRKNTQPGFFDEKNRLAKLTNELYADSAYSGENIARLLE